MSDYVLTNAGASWMASRIAGNAPDLNVVYAVYNNGDSDYIDIISPDMSIQNVLNLSGNTWVMRSSKNVSVTVKPISEDNYQAVVAGIVSDSDVVSKTDAPILSTGKSRLIAIIIGYTGPNGTPDTDTVVAACNITVSGIHNPIPWVANMSVSVSCPISISSLSDQGASK